MNKFKLSIKTALLAVLGSFLAASAMAQVSFDKVATFQAQGGFDESATEIVVYDSLTQVLFSTNGALDRIDMIDLSDPENPTLLDYIYIDSIGGGVNSVAVESELGLLVAAVQNDDKQANGFAVFYTVEGDFIASLEVGALPDMITFTHHGAYVLVACEGEPNDDYSNDPEGSVALIELPAEINDINQDHVTMLDFNAFDDKKDSLIAAGVHIFGGSTPYMVENYFGVNDNDADSIQISFEDHTSDFELNLISTIDVGADFDEGGTEIIAYDKIGMKIFSTNGFTKSIDVIDISDIENPTKIDSFVLDSIGNGANSIAVWNGIVAAAVENDDKQANGYVVFWKTDGTYIGKVEVGALPDMVTFSGDGKYVVVANEGEPNNDYSNDPEGSVAIITLPDTIENLSQSNVAIADFRAFDSLKAQLMDEGVRIFGGSTPFSVDTFFYANGDNADTIVLDSAAGFAPGMWITLDSDNSDDEVDFVKTYLIADTIGDTIIISTEFDYDLEDSVTVEEGTNVFNAPSMWTVYLLDKSSSVSQDLEPEYVAINATNDTAFVTLQENNAFAIVDLVNAEVIDIVALGVKDHLIENNGLDASNKDDSINITEHFLHGMYQPDAISAFSWEGMTYYVTANEGDAREYDGLIEELSIGDLVLDTTAFENADSIQDKTLLGKLKTTIFNGDSMMDGDYEELYSYGARSFSVWDAEGNILFDSGEDFEQITADMYPDYFNSTNDEADFDDRSDNKGPEPEAITTAIVNGEVLVFIGLERMGGVMVYKVNSPTNLEYVAYVNNRDFEADSPEKEGDLAPEDIVFIPAAYSPNGNDLIAVSNEVSGTISFYEVTDSNMVLEPGMWITLDSDNSDDDPDFVRTYQVSDVHGDIVVFETEFDYDLEDSITVEEGTDVFADASMWTAYVLNGSSTVSQDLEPEYIAVSLEDDEAMVTLQENNAYAIVDIERAMISKVGSFGEKDHSLDGNGLDASNKDDEINISTYPVWGMYMPDAIAPLEVKGEMFYVTANEGDAREYDGLIEEFDVKDLKLDTAVFPNADSLQDKKVLGKLDVTNMRGDIDGDGYYEKLYSYGARSFSIWDAEGELVFDSGDEIEQVTASLFPDYFNSNNDESGELDARSDDKGPEPEAIETAIVNDTTYVFVGLERMGGIMVYQVVDVADPKYLTYINDRNYEGGDDEQGDLGPESIEFIEKNADGNAMIAVAHEVSGTIAFYEVELAEDSVAVGINEMLNNGIEAYPLPASDVLTVEVNIEAFVTQKAEIIDATGRTVKTIELNSGVNTLEVASMEAGVYWLLLNGEQSLKQVFTVK